MTISSFKADINYWNSIVVWAQIKNLFKPLIKILGKGWGREYSSPLTERMLHGGSGGALVANILLLLR